MSNGGRGLGRSELQQSFNIELSTSGYVAELFPDSKKPKITFLRRHLQSAREGVRFTIRLLWPFYPYSGA